MPAITTPASAGPMAREMFMLIACSAMACGRSSRVTRAGTMACQVGDITATQVPMANVTSSRLTGPAMPPSTISPISSASSSIAVCTMTSSQRRSQRSASVPAGTASRNTGKALATCTIATIEAAGSNSVISQRAARSYIQLPMFATSPALHSSAYSR